MKQTTIELVVGTYNQKGSEGIYGLTYDPASGALGAPKLLARADNPSFLSAGRQGRLYAVAEIGAGSLDTYALGADGALAKLASAPTLGASPCHIGVSPDGSFVATANYMGGNVSIFKVDAQGVAQAPPQVLQHMGKGPNPDRQEAPHAHWVQWDPSQQFIYAVDLGIDEIKVYPFHRETGRAGAAASALKLQPGDGPRHMFFHPRLPLVYVLNELSNTITVARRSANGSLDQIQRVNLLPDDFKAHSQAAHIHVTADGKHLYASNRGHDSIAVFSVGEDGNLSLVEIEPVLGKWPRNFLVLEDARALLVANQESHNIVGFKIAADGSLSPSGTQVELPQATYIGRLP